MKTDDDRRSPAPGGRLASLGRADVQLGFAWEEALPLPAGVCADLPDDWLSCCDTGACAGWGDE